MVYRFVFLFFTLVSQVALADELPDVSEIVVFKSERRMELRDQEDQVIKTYEIALGADPVGHKKQEGDERTPEGEYTISGRNPKSRFHLSLRISYPNEHDVADAKMRGVSPGGDIMIHGLPNRLGWLGSWLNWYDDKWTDGCIAVTNDEIEEIWELVPVGTKIIIRP